MQLEIDEVIGIFTKKIGEKEKENVLLQAQISFLNRYIDELNEKIQDLEKQLEPLPELAQ